MYLLKKSHSIWLTGLPSSGKSSISKFILKKLGKKFPVILLDSDECNKFFYLKKNYDKIERNKSTFKYIKLTKILLRTNCLVIISANHALNFQRSLARTQLKKKYSEIWINTSLKDCKIRDVKKLFYKAKKGKIKNLVGHDIKFEKPLKNDFKVNTKDNTLDNSAKMIIEFLLKKKIIYVS
jgi:adenylylsulfate kinase